MRAAGNLDSGISARYLASTSLQSMPRGADPRGASIVLVNRVAGGGHDRDRAAPVPLVLDRWRRRVGVDQAHEPSDGRVVELRRRA